MSKQAQLSIRKKILEMAVSSKEGHIASSFSVVEILLAIYMYLDEGDESAQFSQKTILSKGHAVFALYGLMNQFGLITDKEISEVCQYGSYLIGHVPVRPEKNFHIGTGSLGQGFSIALGRAYGDSLKKYAAPQFVVVGDGEFNEGSCWETLLLMKKFPKVRLRVFIDNNLSSTRAIPMTEAFRSILNCWRAVEIDGHDVDEMINLLKENKSEDNLIIICNTTKGYPLKSMIGNPIWHHRTPSSTEIVDFNNELELFFGE